MFSFFRKRKKDITKLPIAEAIPVLYKDQGFRKINIMLWTGDQILFQVNSAEYYVERGIQPCSDKDMVIIHFFNKNKTNTLDAWETFKKHSEEYINYEHPKGVDNYVKQAGDDPKMIDFLIQEEIKKYNIPDLSSIKVQYNNEGYR